MANGRYAYKQTNQGNVGAATPRVEELWDQKRLLPQLHITFELPMCTSKFVLIGELLALSEARCLYLKLRQKDAIFQSIMRLCFKGRYRASELKGLSA